tara:strand:+ start:1847 stop:2032 length:186 start_codon:yes stop_codon:yes gene_type:complete
MGNAMQSTIKNDLDVSVTITGNNDQNQRQEIKEEVKEHINQEQIQTDNNDVKKWLEYCNSW